MRITHEDTQRSWSVRLHEKQPRYFAAAKKAREVMLNKKPARFVMHPTKESSNRVNFEWPSGDGNTLFYFVDSWDLWSMVVESKDKKLIFTIAEGGTSRRATKPWKRLVQSNEIPNCFMACHPNARGISNRDCDEIGAKIYDALRRSDPRVTL